MKYQKRRAKETTGRGEEIWYSFHVDTLKAQLGKGKTARNRVKGDRNPAKGVKARGISKKDNKGFTIDGLKG